MSAVKRIMGTSILSLLLVIWGLFMVCSGRVPDVNYEDDIATGENGYNNGNGDYDSDLMTQLAVLDDESTKLGDQQRNEILAALGIEPVNGGLNNNEKEFLTEELFLDLEVEIAELERRSREKESTIDSLKAELLDTDLRLAALDPLVGTSGTLLASKPPVVSDFSNGFSRNLVSSDFQIGYQEALDDVYGRRYGDAIAKFKQLLKLDSNNDLADNCQYWIGESYYALGDFELAIAEFEKVFAFDRNNKVDDAQFMIGMTYIKLGNSGLAQIELNNLTSFYQNSEYVSRAEREIGGLSI